MNITPELYSEMSKNASPKSNSKVNIPVAFLVGGLICSIGEILLHIFQSMGIEKTAASTWTSIVLVGLSALFTGFGWYEKIAKHAGAGTLVPITGFANAIASSAIEAKSEGFVLGVGAKIFTLAGPVILYGCSASVIFGLFYYFFSG
ncbi:stage V sporulation protein AC [Ruminococcus sp. CAG:624]|nr:stage V sporulation protein AC [Ruminococcus sp.]MDY3844173.1 stage V sporulation protein AC [Ruminococcus sp.]CDF02027.1 stage V sporulation protein AC [Ruminococcus sp. CAG:624]